MPILECEEITPATQELELIGEERKPIICVFDPLQAFHRSVFGLALNGLLEDFFIHWFGSFSQSKIERGGMGDGVSPGGIATLSPILLVSELVIAPWVPDDFRFGVKMLQNIRSNEILKKAFLFVVSNKAALEKSRAYFAALNVCETFTWKDLKEEPIERQRLFNATFDILLSQF